MMCFFVDSFESRMNPRFLAESEKGMLWEPRVIESGREMVEGFKEDEKGKRRAYILLSFSLSWFSIIHVFMSSVHALSSLVRLVTSLRGVDFWSCVSSVKSWWFTEWLAMISERGLVYSTKRMGPSHISDYTVTEIWNYSTFKAIQNTMQNVRSWSKWMFAYNSEWTFNKHSWLLWKLSKVLSVIDDSTPVSQSRHTLRFQPIACHGIMRRPHVLTRPGMVWQAFVPSHCTWSVGGVRHGRKETRKTALLLWPV